MRLAVILLAAVVAAAAAAELYRTGDAAAGGRAEAWGAAPAARADSVRLELMPNWPQHMNIHPNLKPTSVTFADLDGDDTLEIIAGSTDNSLNVWDIHGNQLAGWPKMLSGGVQSKVAVGDLFADGKMQLVVATRDGKVHAFNVDGSLVAGWPRNSGGAGGFVGPTLADLDGDDTLEIIAPQYPPGTVNVWYADGTPCPGWPKATDYLACANASVADVDRDGEVEICVPSYWSLYLWDADGDSEPGWPRHLGTGASYSQPLLYDLDHDGYLEVGFSCYPHTDGQVYLFRYDGTDQPGWPVTMCSPQPYVCPVAAGFQSDSVSSVFCGGHYFGGPGLFAWYADGSPMPGWPVNPDFWECSPVALDLDGTGRRALLIANNTTPGSLYAYYEDGSQVPGFPVPTPAPAGPNSPTVGDVDLDGAYEVGLVTMDGSVSLWKAAGSTYHPWLTDWGTMYHDNWHTGWQHPARPLGLSAARGNPGVRLTWRANQEPDVIGYRVYRTTSSGSGYALLNRAPVSDTTFHDTLALGDSTYYYGVTAVIRARFEGRMSDEAGINPTALAEGNGPAPGDRPLPGLARGRLLLPTVARGAMFDHAGREVLKLHGGSNPVANLAPGVYFVRLAGGPAAAKVVLAR